MFAWKKTETKDNLHATFKKSSQERKKSEKTTDRAERGEFWGMRRRKHRSERNIRQGQEKDWAEENERA